MAFWNTDRIKAECEARSIVAPYRAERAKRCSYELGVGSEAFVTSKTGDTTHLAATAKVSIPPGQFGLLTTHEIVFVPPDAIAFISIRAGVKFQGLINVSGFHVDPGFRGKLKFAVYNAGSREIDLDQDEQVFVIWFADLNAPSPDPYGNVDQGTNVITSLDVSRLKGDVASPGELKKKIEESKAELDKKIHACEQHVIFNRMLLTVLLTAVVGLFFTSFVKQFVDGSQQLRQPPATVARDAATTALTVGSIRC